MDFKQTLTQRIVLCEESDNDISYELCEIPAEVKFTKYYFEQTLSILAKPMSFPDLGGDGYLDLVVMDDDNTISEVTVYIDRDIEFNTLSIGNIVQQCCFSVEGLELEKEIVKLKEKILDLMDLNDVYSSYVEELSNVLGQYEPTDYNH